MPFDGLVFLSNCDKITPGMLMAMGRLNIPSILVSGGPMLAGKIKKATIDIVSVFEAVGQFNAGKISKSQLDLIENAACPGPGSCAGLFTANTMNALSEVLGVSLSGNGTIPAVYADRIRLAKESGKKVVELVRKNVCPWDIVSWKSFYNAVAVDLALGGSTNTVLHLPAIANSFEVPFEINLFNELSQKIPHICSLSPVGKYHVEDLHLAGGIYGVMKRLAEENLIQDEAQTIYLKKIREVIEKAVVLNQEIIRPLDKAYGREGGLAILSGNIAPQGAVTKLAGVPQKMRYFQGRAVVFDGEELATEAILSGKIKKGDIVVIRYEGPQGGPGMREMLSPTAAISGMGLIEEVALITDGRFSGGSKGAVIGHISPEAAAGGLIAIIENGDLIEIDFNNKKLNLLVEKSQIDRRYKNLQPFSPKEKNKFLLRYSKLVEPASKGAIFKEP